MRRCVIVDDEGVVRLLVRYNGIGKPLLSDEKEILLFALYNESLSSNGLAYRSEIECAKKAKSSK